MARKSLSDCYSTENPVGGSKVIQTKKYTHNCFSWRSFRSAELLQVLTLTLVQDKTAKSEI